MYLAQLRHFYNPSFYIYIQAAAIGSGGDGVYDTTSHGEPPKPIPNPEDPQYSHIEQGEEEKKNVTKVCR